MVYCLTTNPQPQNDRLADLLRVAGHAVSQCPLHRVEYLSDVPARLRQELAGPTGPVWLCCVSRHAVQALAVMWPQLPGLVHVAAVGEGTADALRGYGVEPVVIARGDSAALATELTARPDWSPGQRVIAAHAEEGETGWHAMVRRAGGLLVSLPTHRLIPSVVSGTDFLQALAAPIDAVLFTAPSAVRQYAVIFAAVLQHPVLRAVRYFPIGATTAAAMRGFFAVAGTPTHPDFAALAAIVK